VNPVPDPLLFFSGSAGNRTRASGSVAKNSDHWTTEAVDYPRIGHFKLLSIVRLAPLGGGRGLRNVVLAKLAVPDAYRIPIMRHLPVRSDLLS
jgi:hypothetical protein